MTIMVCSHYIINFGISANKMPITENKMLITEIKVKVIVVVLIFVVFN